MKPLNVPCVYAQQLVNDARLHIAECYPARFQPGTPEFHDDIGVLLAQSKVDIYSLLGDYVLTFRAGTDFGWKRIRCGTHGGARWFLVCNLCGKGYQRLVLSQRNTLRCAECLRLFKVTPIIANARTWEGNFRPPPRRIISSPQPAMTG